MKQPSKFRLLFWHKLLISLGGAMIVLSLGLTLAAMTTLQRASKDIGVIGKDILATQTERFLDSIVTGQCDTIDLQLNQSRIAAINGAKLVEVLLNTNRTPDAQFLAGLLADAGIHSTTVHFASVDGRLIAYPPSLLDAPNHIEPDNHTAGYKFSDFPVAPGAKQATRWSAVHYNPHSALYDRVVEALAPVYANGRLAGILGISVSVGRLVSQFNHRQTIQGSYSFLIDQQHLLVSGPPHAKLDLASAGAQQNQKGALDLRQMQNPALDSVFSDMVLGNSAVQRIQINKRPKYLAYRPLTQTDWSLGVAVPVALATVASDELVGVIEGKGAEGLARMVLTTLLLLGIALLAAGLITRRMTQPLLEMADAADHIAKGDLEREIKISGSDEISELAQAFNAMTQQLKRYIGSIEQQRQELFDSEARYRALFENSPISLLEEDFSQVKRYLDELRTQGIDDFLAYLTQHPEKVLHCAQLIRIVDVNEATMKLYGAESKAELLKSPLAMVPSEDAMAVLTQELVAIAEGRMFKIECANHTLDGRRLTIVLRSLVPPGYRKTWKKVFVAINDITASANAEQEKKQLEVQLRQAYKMEAIGTLAGGIAHDFNNILSAIIGYTDLLNIELEGQERKRRYTQNVMNAATRAKNLVTQILAFSRQTDQIATPVSIKQVAEETLKLLRASLPSTIDIQSELESDSVVLADATQIHQVLMNLCTNAGQAMKKEGGVLTVRLEEAVLDHGYPTSDSELLAGAYLKIQIKDTGHGMPPETMERIFDPFYTTKSRHQGTGMGLSVVHGIIKSYNGHIAVRSTPNQGSTFDVYLPIADEPGFIEVQKIDSDLPGGDESILIVDDEQALADLGHMMLSRIGYHVTAHTDSLSALEAFKKTPAKYDLIITDMTMPNMTGDKLAAEIRAINSHIPIIICSGFSEQMDDIKTDKNISGILIKPLDMTDLANTVRKALDNRITLTSN